MGRPTQARPSLRMPFYGFWRVDMLLTLIFILSVFKGGVGQRPPQPPRPPPIPPKPPSPRPPFPPPPPSPFPPSPFPPSPLPPSPRPPPPSPGPPIPPEPPSPPSPPPSPPSAPPAPPTPPPDVTKHFFQTPNALYWLYTEPASWVTAHEFCRSMDLSLAAWPSGNLELYRIFNQGWNYYYSKEIWVGAVKRATAAYFEFTDIGGELKAIDGLNFSFAIDTQTDVTCMNDTVHGCCGLLTDRMVGTFIGMVQTERTPLIQARNCLIRKPFMCYRSIPSSPPPPSPPAIPLIVLVELRFILDFSALSNQSGRVQQFKDDVVDEVLSYYSRSNITEVKIKELQQDASTDGATVVRLLVTLPRAITADIIDTVLFALIKSPSLIFDDAFRATYLIGTPIRSSVLATYETSALAPSPSVEQMGTGDSKDNSKAVALGAGLGVGFGVALLIAAMGAYMYYSRSRSARRAIHEIH